MEIRLERGNGERAERPVYQQIADQIRAEVERGALAEGDRLPPIRELARSLGVNRDTVGLAYEALAADGVVAARVGRGTFVRGRRPRGGGAALAEPVLSPMVERLLDHERNRPRYAGAADAVPLHAVIPDPSLFPVEAFRRAVNRTLGDDGAALLGYGAPTGHAGLRELLAAHLGGFGVRVGPESVVLSQGATQGITLALRLFAEPGDTVAVEEPTYQNVLASLAGLGLRPLAVPMRGEGPDLDALDRALARPDVKLFYTIPTFHNPMGTSTSLDHRRELLGVAERRGKPVLEDAFEADLRISGRPVPPLAALDESGLVVQLLSFSKSLFPGVRAGAVVARGRLVEALHALKHATDLSGALPLQAALADFLRSGAYERHLAGLRSRVRKRRDAMLAALEESMPEGTIWTRPEGGYQIWVELPEPLDTRELLAEAARAGVLFAPGYQFHLDGRPSTGLRLSYSAADEAAIRRGVALLGEVATARLASGPPVARVAAVNV